MSKCNCIHVETPAEARNYRRIEKRLKANDAKNGTHTWRDYVNEEARKFRATRDRCRELHGITFLN